MISEITPIDATQGATYPSGPDDPERFAAAGAIDGDLKTRARTPTNDGLGWLKLQFDGIYFIHKVVLYNIFYTNWYYTTGGCVRDETAFSVCIDNYNNVDVSVYQGEVLQKSCGKLHLTYALEQSDQIYTLLCSIEGDTVILSKDTGDISVYEIAVTSSGFHFTLKKRHCLEKILMTLIAVHLRNSQHSIISFRLL